MVLDAVAVLELEAGVAVKWVAGAVEDAGELVCAIVIEVVADGFRIEGEGGGIVGVAGLGLVNLGDGDAAAEGIVDDADVGSDTILQFVCPNELQEVLRPVKILKTKKLLLFFCHFESESLAAERQFLF